MEFKVDTSNCRTLFCHIHRHKAAIRVRQQLAVSGPPTFDKKVSGAGFLFNVRYRPISAGRL